MVMMVFLHNDYIPEDNRNQTVEGSLGEARKLIDIALEQTSSRNDRLESIFSEFTRSVILAIPGGAEVQTEGLLGIASDRIRPDYRRLVSWGLMRFLGIHGRFPTKPSILRPKLITFIEQEIGKELSQIYSIDFTQQSHIVELSLSSVVPSIEQDFFESTKFRGLEGFNTFAKQVRKSLNSKKNAGLLFTFMDRQVVNSVFSNALSAIEEFCANKDLQTLDNYYNSINSCDSCLEQLASIPTKYIKNIEQLIRSAKEAVNKQMQEMKLSEPAQLQISLEPKKYPLHLASAKFQIRIRITNNGTGNAFNCHLDIESTEEITLFSKNMIIGNLHSEESRVIYIEAEVIAPERLAILQVNIYWTNFDGSNGSSSVDLEIESQDPEINWEALELKQPYALEVATGEDFVGRNQLLKRLLSTFSRPNPGSVYLWGQKRVGKTSVARALATQLKDVVQQISVAYLETIRDVTAEDTINRMCTRLIEQMRDTHALAKLPIQSPTGTLAPLGDFLEQATAAEPERKFILIIDEFDELPVELYKARGIADAFFQTLGKGIAGKQNVGVLLVGGERIPVIIRDQGMRLNMYRPERIDYFNRDKEWDSFVELVCRPGAPLEFTPNAIELLWEFSAGNPYFLKEIASRLAQMMIEQRDAYITKDEVYEGVRRTLNEVEANSFAHYWEDGLIAVDDNDFFSKRSERVRFLLTVADILRVGDGIITKEKLVEQAVSYRCTTNDTERQLRSFQDRGIIEANRDQYRFRVRLFQEWLKERGYLDLTAMVASELHLAEQHDKELSEAVSSIEVRDLVERWGAYQGRKRTESEVRDWLKQFGSSSDQRLMLKLLQHLRFYSGDIIREKFEQAHRSVVRSIITIVEKGRRSRRDILVSYLGTPGSSGPSMARLYRQTNNIYRDNCVSPDEILKHVLEVKEISALVFVDDFVGTGQTVTELLKKLKFKYPELPHLLKARGVQLWYVVVAGTELGMSKIEKELENFTSLIHVFCANELGDQDKAFSESSPIWSTVEERITAEEIAGSFGKRLEPRAPWGFGNTQALVVFEENCPNNSLPILYKARKGMESFKPLFPRS